MAEYDETTYGERIADVYDLFYGKRDNPETVADFLAPLAGKRLIDGAAPRLTLARALICDQGGRDLRVAPAAEAIQS